MNRQVLAAMIRGTKGSDSEMFQSNLEITLTTGRQGKPTKHSHRRQKVRSWAAAQGKRRK